jgi:AcrR family transcriptional regulator
MAGCIAIDYSTEDTVGRPSLAIQRREQVLAAFARCIARSGFAGTSLENVADEAGLARGHVRHYLGNRRDQVYALCEWVNATDQEKFDEALGPVEPQARFDGLMHYLFDPSFYAPSEDLDVYLALFDEARRDDKLREIFRVGYSDMLDTMSRTLGDAHPQLGRADARALAYMLLCAAIGNGHLSQMDMKVSLARRLGATCRRVMDVLTAPITSA